MGCPCEDKLDLSGGSGGISGQNVYTAPDGTTAVSSASTYENGNFYYLQNLFDGSDPAILSSCSHGSVHNCYWMTSSSGQQTLTITFAQSRFITKIRVRSVTDSNRRSNYRAETSSSADATSWIDRSGGFVNTAGWNLGEHGDVTVMDNVKVVKLTLSQEDKYGVCLEEVEFFYAVM